MMLQVDGSRMTWLEAEGHVCVSSGPSMTPRGKSWGHFPTGPKKLVGYFTLFASIFCQHGLPQSIYSDRSFGILDRPGTTVEGTVE